MTPRQIFLPIASLILFGLSSCTVSQHSIKRIYFPSAETSSIATEKNSEMVALAKSLSKKLHIPLDAQADDLGLYAFAADWMGVPYRFGASSMRGTDCSGFAYNLYRDVYQTNIGRTSSADLMNTTERISRDELRQGDLVFFNINNRRGGRASHVGIYLKDGKFVHATTRQGVMISSLSESYYRRTYIGAGRVNGPQ